LQANARLSQGGMLAVQGLVGGFLPKHNEADDSAPEAPLQHAAMAASQVRRIREDK